MNRSNLFDRRYRPCWQIQGQYYSDGGTVITDTACAYCGERATDREHVIPYSFVDGHILATQGSDERLWTWILPACSECNGIASDQLFPSPHAKRRHIQSRLEARYYSEIHADPWSDDDYDDMGPGLRQYVQARQAQADLHRERVAYRGPLPISAGSPSLVSALRTELTRRGVANGRVPGSAVKAEAA
jgi:5-methylcytosine-specific restriction endonuclease McrA